AQNGATVLGDHVLDDESLEARVLDIEPDPAVLGELLNGVDQNAQQVVVQHCGQIIPAVPVDGGRERIGNVSCAWTRVAGCHGWKLSNSGPLERRAARTRPARVLSTSRAAGWRG